MIAWKIFLMSAWWCGAAEPTTELPESPPAVAPRTKDTESEDATKASAPKRLLRKKNAPETDKRDETKDRAADLQEPPAVPDRNIPGPPDERIPSELDKALIGDLGANLEKAPDEQTNPLLRAGERMRTVEERLARLDGSEETIDIQVKIVKDLETLLAQAQNQKRQQKKSQKKQQRGQQQQGQGEQQKASAASRNNQQSRQSADGARKGEPGRIQSGPVKEIKDVWGHLSGLMRDEFDQYAKDSFLPEYREMLERYYTSIASKSEGRQEPAP